MVTKKTLLFLSVSLLALSGTITYTHISNTSKASEIVVQELNKDNVLNSTVYSKDTSELPVAINEKSLKKTQASSENEIEFSLDDDSFEFIKLKKVYIDDIAHYEYHFKTQIKANINNTPTLIPIQSKVLLTKDNNVFTVASIGDLKKDVTKKLMHGNLISSETVSNNASEMLLVYTNEFLDVKLNYPEDYSYISKHNGQSSTNDLITFYPLEKTQDEYIQIELSSTDTDTQKKIKEYKAKGYTQTDKTYESKGGIQFIELEQSFLKENTTIVEKIYINTTKYKSLETIIATVRMEETIFQQNIVEVETILKSIE